jgi:hypothetical protein
VTTATTNTASGPIYEETFKGLRVPWVTRWSGEVLDDPYKLTKIAGKALLRYETPAMETRDSHVVLWQREGTTRSGEPQFSQLSTFRQRAAMNRGRCQVCGRKLHPGPVNWLLTAAQIDHTPEGEVVTMSPPTCDACIPVAKSLCPHLRLGWVTLRVLEYSVWGVYGEGVVFNPTSGQVERLNGVMYKYDKDYGSFDAGSILAKQQVVRLDKYAVLETS